MIYSRNFIKLISLLVLIAFAFYSDIFVYSQSGGDIVNQFQMAKEEYQKGQYVSAKTRVERIIGTIKGQGQDKKDILGSCYLLLGAIYEENGEQLLAEENYRRAKEEYGVESIEGAALENLIVYKKIIKGERIIVGEGKKPETKKKKFPVLLAIGGVVVVVAAVILLTKKKKTSPIPEFVISTDNLNVPEGGTAEFNVRLSAKPSSDISVTVTRVSGDTDINVQSGSSLTFTTFNWIQNQTVTLAANEDVDTSNGSATIRMSASGLQNKDLTATEQDNDVLRFVTDKDIVNIPEGETNFFTIKLSNQPAADVQVAVTWISGDTDISVQSGGSLTFTASNWNIYQTVMLRAVEDADTTNDRAVIRISAAGIQDKDITAIEDDNDNGGCTISITITSPLANETVSGIVPIQAAVTGNCIVDRVEFYIDSVLKGTDTSEPYSCDWDTATDFVGPHTLRVVAYSATGKNNVSQITVTVTR
ncbi:MAG: Ig-like domain-containing protein [Candidatus Aminicenantes bacterium]|nr:Ig-like domain-containing protein [Candidatus Aminicenantes bacterium]